MTDAFFKVTENFTCHFLLTFATKDLLHYCPTLAAKEKTEKFKCYHVILRNMVILVSKISRGSRMDQIYIPKERAPGLEAGTLVVIEPALPKIVEKPKPHYYSVGHLEPIKVAVIEKIFEHFEHLGEVDNVLVAGSFLEPGFKFEDVDVVAISDKKIDASRIEKNLSTALGVNMQLIVIGFKALLKGISTDPLFEMLVSRFVSRKRIIFKTKRKFNYKLLDLHLFKSKSLFDNFDALTGNGKYKLTRNIVAILLFLDGRKLSAEAVNSEIEKLFGRNSVKLIKENMTGKAFLAKYKSLYNRLFDRIMAGVRNDSKQE